MPELLFPLNGAYIPDSSLNLSFYAPGLFGIECDPILPESFYQV